jgi:hypothetical protein
LHRQINEQNWLDAIGDLAKTGLKMAAGTDRPPAKNPNEVQAAFSKDFSDNLTTELNAAIRAGVVDPNLQTQATATGASSQAPAQATGQPPLTASHSTADWVHSHRTVTLCEHNI